MGYKLVDLGGHDVLNVACSVKAWDILSRHVELDQGLPAVKDVALKVWRNIQGEGESAGIHAPAHLRMIVNSGELK